MTTSDLSPPPVEQEPPDVVDGSGALDDPDSAAPTGPTSDPAVDPPGWRRWTRQEPLAALVFALQIAFALPYLLFVVAADRWFLRDEWYFLAGRDGGTFEDLFGAHNEHWSTVPILAYRVLFAVFGVRSYLPYLLAVVLLHLASCVLLRAVLRNNGVSPWIATATASVFVLFGAGEENIIWAFQIGMAGSVTFGLAALLLVDHDGGFGRRTVFGLVCGLISLMCSGVGVAMVIGIGGAMLLKRGWKVAAWSTVPLGAAYLAWYAAYVLGKPGTSPFGRPPLSTSIEWVIEGVPGVFLAVSQHAAAATLLVACTLAGIVLIAVTGRWRGFRLQAGAAVGFAIGLPLFFFMTSLGRWIVGVGFARSSRYVYDATIFALPLVAVGVDALVRRWRWSLVPAVVLLLVGIPGNIGAFNTSVFDSPAYYATKKQAILGSAYSGLANDVPEWVRPDPDVFNGEDLTIGWLRMAKKNGKLPDPPEMTDREIEAAKVRLSLVVADERVLAKFSNCHNKATGLTLEEGEHVKLRRDAEFALASNGKPVSEWVSFRPDNGDDLVVVVDGLEVLVRPSGGGAGPIVCTT